MNDIDFAKKYLEDLLSFFGLNTEVSLDYDDRFINLEVPSTHLNGFLIGQRGNTLKSLQFMINSALINAEEVEGDRRVVVDIGGYKKQNNDKLRARAQKWVDDVVRSGESKALEPMNGSDRRVIHQLVSETEGIVSESEGEGRDRHIVIKKQAAE